MPPSDHAALVLAGEAGLCPGFVAGMRQPAWVAPLTWQGPPPPRATLDALSGVLGTALPEAPGAQLRPAAPAEAALRWVGHWTRALLWAAGLPVFDPSEVLPPAPGEAGPWWLLVPAHGPTAGATAEAFAWTCGLLARTPEGGSREALSGELPGLLRQLRTLAPHGANTVPLLKAAHEAGIPTCHVAGGVYQIGQGALARLLKSTFTDQTPAIGAEWARDKRLAAAVLRRAGLPTPAHRLVKSHDDALAAAAALGYPVVVKPADRDGGVGVAAGLEAPEAVTAAFDAARACSEQVLVEQHVPGRDHRLTVFQGEVIWAIERLPGGVTGDGESSVETLVEALNRDPRRGDGPHRPMAWLDLDGEALALLAEAGLSPTSVPAAGGFVRLRRAANISRGGTPLAVTDRVHPDNRALAVRAAAALRLDLAGVDLLIPDIGRSWLETGAAICEVNGQPELGTATNDRLHARVLHGLVRGTGRVPVVLVVGAGVGTALVPAIAAALTAAGHTVGCLDEAGPRVGDARVAPLSPEPRTRVLDGGTQLLAAPDVTAVVLAVEEGGLLETGLPVARFDVLVAASVLREDGAGSPGLTPAVLASLLRACDGTAIPVAEAGLRLQAAPSQPLTCWVTAPVPRAEVVGWVREAVQEAVAHHATPPPALDSPA